MAKNKKTYTAAPAVPPELMERLALIQEVLAGKLSVSQAARTLGISRNHFQSLLHRGLAAMVQAIGPRPSGRPAKSGELLALQEEVERLRRENVKLQARVGTTDRLLEVASGLLQGRIHPGSRSSREKKTRGSPNEKKPDEPDAERRAKLQSAEHMRGIGLPAAAAARVAGVHAATLRRWKARLRRGEPLSRAPRRPSSALPAQAAERAGALVRSLKGLVGAESLRRSVPELSRRQAARVKAHMLSCMERERKLALTRVSVTRPDVMRGLDAMYLPSNAGTRYALFSADAALPYRTSVQLAERYDATSVARSLTQDMRINGAPLVYRLDRASVNDAPAVRALLEAYEVLVLHGPPRCPRYYGQLERQNREHRAWTEDFDLLAPEQIEQRLQQMLEALNKLWRRRTLHWRTAHEAWNMRSSLQIDRRELREEVNEHADRIRRNLQCRGKPADLAERLAIEQALEMRGYLRQQVGGWC